MTCIHCNVTKGKTHFYLNSKVCKSCKEVRSEEIPEIIPLRVSYSGSIYVVKNQAWFNWYKVGLTRVSPERRLDGFNVSSPHRDYELVKVFSVPDVFLYEKLIHSRLRNSGFLGDYEWFYGDVDKLLYVIDTFIIEVT
jgi:hypothetical protein